MFYLLEETEDRSIVVSDLDAVAFKNMLIYLYSGSVSFRCISEALSTCEAGDRYEIPELRDLAEKYLANQDYKPSIVWPILENAEELNMDVTKRRCLDFVRRNTREVLGTEGFLAASLRVIQTVLKLNEVSVSEIELLDFVARWVKRRSRRNRNETQAMFASLAPFIRFKAIKPEELCTFMNRHPECLDDSNSSQILKHLVEPNSNPLPEWCNRHPPRKNSLQPSQNTFVQKLWRTLKNPQLFD